MTDSKDNAVSISSQQPSENPGSYFERTKTPIYALMYILPFIGVYEIGTALLNRDIISDAIISIHGRVVSFLWMSEFISWLGFSPRSALLTVPLLVVVILLAMQIASKKPWHYKFRDSVPISIECLLLTVPLLIFSIFFNQAFASHSQTACSVFQVITCWASQLAAEQGPCLFAEIITGIGAGIYEELIFRLIMITLLMMLFENLLSIDRNYAILLSVVISAVLFSLHHHIFYTHGQIAAGEPFVLAPFLFRLCAGVYFAILFAYRGFAVAAGTHAFYDIIAALLNNFFENG